MPICAAAFLSQIKASDSVTLSTVNKVVDNVTFIMEGALRDIKERTVNTLKELGIDSDNTVIQELLSKIDAYSDPFNNNIYNNLFYFSGWDQHPGLPSDTSQISQPAFSAHNRTEANAFSMLCRY